MITLLEKLGFSEKEAKVYLAALELAEDSVQNIAKKAGINRATTYVILEKLMGMGIISTYEKGKKTYFVAEDPKELLNILNEEKQEIEEREKDVKDNLNQLNAIYNLRKGKPVVRFFEGADGLLALERYGRNLLKKNTDIYTITPIDLLEKRFPERRKISVSERVKLGIKSKAIYTRESGAFSDAENKSQLREGILIDSKKFPLNTIITTYPEWGIKIFYLDESRPFGVAIESKEIAQNMKILFELAWKGAKSLKKQ